MAGSVVVDVTRLGRTLIAVATLAAPIAAAAEPPLRVHVQCESYGRTKACPTFLLGLLEGEDLLLPSPRAGADVTLYVTALAVAATDRLHLRLVGTVPGAPRELELDVDLDSRADDDSVIAALRAALWPALAPFVAARHPGAVEVSFTAPGDGEPARLTAPKTTGWSANVGLGGYGSWSREYARLSMWTSIGAGYVARDAVGGASMSGEYGRSDQPPLVIDGEEISLDTQSWGLSADLRYARLITRRWTVGVLGDVAHQDPAGEHQLSWSGGAGVTWDRYAPDDPRGNRLSIGYVASLEVDRYNRRNELGEHAATFGQHKLVAGGSVRKDQVSFGLDVALEAEVTDPGRRNRVYVNPSISLTLGDHVDLSTNLSVTRRTFPRPLLDDSDFEELTRGSYTQPLSVDAYLSLRLHWDADNGVRNDRFAVTGY